MSFHPIMPYGEGHHRSDRVLLHKGEPFTYTPERAAQLEEICGKYPPERRKSAVLAALYLVQDQQGYLTANALRHVAQFLRHHAGGSRGRRELLRDVLQGAGRQVRAAGLPHAVVRAGRRRARHRDR